jgi:hypothetical protein
MRGLRAFDRVRRLEPPVKIGQPGRRGAAVTALRVVELRPGSAVLTLEGITDAIEGEELFPGAGTLAVENFRALLDAIEQAEPLDADVVDALANARSALGRGGRIGVVDAKGRRKRRVVIDEETITSLESRTQTESARKMTVSGRLHLIDIEPPPKVAIRAPDGTDWICRYSAEDLDRRVKALLGRNAWARGFGALTGARSGQLELEEIQPITEFEETPLFTYQHPSLKELMADQGIAGPQGPDAFAPPSDVTVEELEQYVEAISDD